MQQHYNHPMEDFGGSATGSTTLMFQCYYFFQHTCTKREEVENADGLYIKKSWICHGHHIKCVSYNCNDH